MVTPLTKVVTKVRRSSCKVPVFFFDFNRNWNFCSGFSKLLHCTILRKPVQR